MNLRKIPFFLTIFSALICLLTNILHFANIWPGNPLTWTSYLTSLIFLLLAAALWRHSDPPAGGEESHRDLGRIRRFFDSLWSLRMTTLVIIILSLIFVITHLWNWQTAPWNHNGLFDDAAWDIYLSNKYVDGEYPFQLLRYDDISRISRELVFHYFINGCFRLFGYNLLTFQMALLFLGFVTFIFTILTIQALFNRKLTTVIGALLLNFLPLHFIHTFVGHRYAMAAPLFMSSFYFLFTGFKNKSFFRVVVSGILAGLSVEGAIMGKQYYYAIIAAAFLYLIFDHQKALLRINLKLAGIFILSSVITVVPYLVYIYFNPVYWLHEQVMTQEFLSGDKLVYWQRLLDTFFKDFTYSRWFIPDFLPIPLIYYFLLVPGIIIALSKKNYVIILAGVIPVTGAFVAGAGDWRILHGVGFWVITMTYTINYLINQSISAYCHPRPDWGSSYQFSVISFQIKVYQLSVFLFNKLINRKPTNINPKTENREPISEKSLDSRFPACRQAWHGNDNKLLTVVKWGIIAGIIIFGLAPSVRYLYQKSLDPNSILHFNQKTVVSSRFLKDMVAEEKLLLTTIRTNEFKMFPQVSLSSDFLICQQNGFAIIHLFLSAYNDQKILSFCDQLPMNTLSKDEIWQNNKKAITAHELSGKDLVLVWEQSDKTADIIAKVKPLVKYGHDKALAVEQFSFYVLTIKKENIKLFKESVADLLVGN